MRARAFDPSTVRSILVMRLYFIGDVLLSTPVFGALRSAFPGASITALVKRRSSEVLLNNPNVDEIVVYDDTRRYHSPVWQARLASRLRRRRFDLAVDLTGDLRSSWLLFATDPGFRVGFNHAGLGRLLDRRIPYRATSHGVEHLLSSVEAVGARAVDATPKLFLTNAERAEATALLGRCGIDSEQFVALAPGANWSFRRWPAESFGELAAMLRERRGIRTVVTGSREDSGLAADVIRAAGGEVVDLSGRTGLRGLAALAERASVFVANDSGPLHVAAAVGAPVVGLFGPNTPEVYAPRAERSRVVWHRFPCSPCDQKKCTRPDDACMAAIGVEEVHGAVESLLDEGRSE